MNYFTQLRLKTIRFWKENKQRMLIIIIAIILVITADRALKKYIEKDKKEELHVTYKPHTIVMSDNDETVPQEYAEPIQDLISTYFNYCNNGEYENAYNLITNDCKNAYYPTLQKFKEYVDYVFQGKKKIYNIQSYSVKDNTFIYSIRILDDILANGTTDGYYYYEEKLVLKEVNGHIELSIGEFISKDNPNIAVEDEYMKIEIVDRVVDYETETYKIIVTNKTDDKYIIISDGKQANEIKLNLGTRADAPDIIPSTFVARPGSFNTQTITFSKFYDDDHISQGIIFGAVRVLSKYNFSTGTTEEDLKNAIRLYSIEVPLK